MKVAYNLVAFFQLRFPDSFLQKKKASNVPCDITDWSWRDSHQSRQREQSICEWL